MLTKLLLRNFQCHGKLQIELDPKITVITGNTDRGKSAIIRALRWLVFNRPNSSSFIKKGTKHCRVSVLVDGEKLVRDKGKENKYSIGDKEFKAVKGDVPRQVQKLLKSNEVNFQFQFDPLFWITDTPGQLTKNLNQIINMGDADKATKIASRNHNEAKSYLKVFKQKKAEKDKKREQLKWILEAGQELEEIQTLENDHQQIIKYQNKIESLLDSHQSISQNLKIQKEASNEASKISDLLDEFTKSKDQELELRRLIQSHKQSVEDHTKLKKLLASAEKLDQKLRRGKCPICKRPLF